MKTDICVRLRDPLNSMTKTECRKMLDEAAAEIDNLRDGLRYIASLANARLSKSES